MVKQRLLGEFTLTNDQKDFSLYEGVHGSDNVSLDTGNYFMFGYTGESVDQFISHFVTTVQAIGAPYLNFDMSYDTSTNRIEIDFDGYNVDITWTDTELQSLLGFTGSQTGSNNYLADNQPRYVWNPSNPASMYPLGLKEFWNPKSTSYVGRSKDGTTYSTQGSIIYDAVLGFNLLTGEEIYIPDTGTVNRDLQSFFVDVIGKGKPIRIQTDSSQLTSDYFKTGLVAGDEDEPVGSFSDFIDRSIKTYNGLWNVEFNFIKQV